MSRVTDGRARRMIHGLVKQTQFCVSFIAPLSRNESFQTPQRCQFLNGSVFRSLPIVMNLGYWPIKYYLRCKRQNGIFAQSAKWHKGVLRLGGARGTKGVWRPHVWT